ncbi:cyclic-nucleotide-gated cation channel [Culex quinquefasciatus]|uniref:Cyclic-nucleotide-gated cation channel n=1 Tax=Culex quinquefasciatus TaxID=7176 RepID=B0XJJ0_CULQU|nr:cyclic-nucleotide-gated cation channel [Culex quinquefasciatus]|eukprot:XP_001869812.1 cyclic-nucleotide-gated cation channel [Culex quinquefasciatus]
MVQRIDISTIGAGGARSNDELASTVELSWWSEESSGGRRSLRRWLNAFRHRLSKRGRSKPPDQFLDKFSSTTASDTRLHQTAQALPSDGTCSRLSVDPSLPSHYRWLSVVSLAVLYNIVFVIGRAVFWEINRQAPALWWTLDYLCDFIYLADTLVHCHEGKYS